VIDADYVARLMVPYLPRQRWFSGGGGELREVRTVAHEVWRDEWPGLVWALVDAFVDERPPIRCQVFVGLRPLGERAEFLDGKGRWLLGDVVTDAGEGLAYDAFVDSELSRLVLDRVAPGLGATTMRPLAVEQSNTSVVFDEEWILKVFRQVQPGPNPDIEVARALEGVGFEHVPSTVGVWRHDGAELAVVRRFVRGGSDGFELARTSLRDLFDARVSPERAGGDFGPEAGRLGTVTAQLHVALAAAFGVGDAEPARWANELATELRRADASVLPAHRVERVYAAIAGLDPDASGAAIRVHGDYHLGQVLRGDEGWFVLDFEGEPDRPADERRATASPLRDVAGMLRSFAYAPEVVLGERHDEAPDTELRALAVQWEARARTAFLRAYLAEPGVRHLLPSTDVALARLLFGLELGKAVYEVGYERGHRPDWVAIPLSAVERISAAALAGAPLVSEHAEGPSDDEADLDAPDRPGGPDGSDGRAGGGR
jgi:maltokinase